MDLATFTELDAEQAPDRRPRLAVWTVLLAGLRATVASQ